MCSSRKAGPAAGPLAARRRTDARNAPAKLGLRRRADLRRCAARRSSPLRGALNDSAACRGAGSKENAVTTTRELRLGPIGQIAHRAPQLLHQHPDGTEERMAFFTDPEGRYLALMSLLPPRGD
jgi:hypothetical protein